MLLGGWAVEGFLFALFFILLRIPFRKFAGSKIINAIIGMASGLLAFSPLVAFTYYNAVIRPESGNMIILAELKRSTLLNLDMKRLDLCFLVGLLE